MLRPYQRRFIDDFRRTLLSCKEGPWIPGEPHPRSVVGQIATGGGKTHSAAEFVREALAGALPGVRTASFWADLREITSDTTARFAEAGLDVGVFAATAPPGLIRPKAPVQVVQVQTVTRRLDKGALPPRCDLLILDEAHICEGADLAQALRAAAPRYLVGLTATPSRGDGRGLGRTFGHLVQGPQTGWLQRHCFRRGEEVATVGDGYLVPCEVIAPQAGAVRGNRLAMDPVAAVKAYAGPHARVLVFCGDGQAKATAASFVAGGYAAEVLAADTHPAQRRTQRERLTRGDLRVLCTVDCAVKGWDCPAVDTVVLARGVSVPGSYLQMVGRALRPSPSTGKQAALLIDLKGVTWLHGLPEWERTWSLGDEAVVLTQAAGWRFSACLSCAWLGVGKPAGSPCPRCGKPLGRPVAPPAVARAEKMARVAGMSLEARREAYRQSLTRSLASRAARVPAFRREQWIEDRVGAALRAFDAKLAQEGR